MNFFAIGLLLLVGFSECICKSNKAKPKNGPTDQDVFARKLVVQEPKVKDIIRESGLYFNNTAKQRFAGDVLGFITPWNNDGFDIAKTFHGKFTMLSPVWLSFSTGGGMPSKLTTNDIQKKWLKEIRKLNNEEHHVKIYPRVLFESWTVDEIMGLYRDARRQNDLVSSLVQNAKTYQFSGFVIEIWNQFVFSGVNTDTMVSLVRTISQKLRGHDLDTVLVVPPRGRRIQLFTQDHFDELAPYVKAFSVMTYDYSSLQRPGANSPITWARECVELLVPDPGPKRTQILLGLNFYGYNFTPQGGGPIIGTNYLKILETFKGKIQWDDKSKEHFFEAKTPTGSGYIFYPTLYSIQQRLELAEEMGIGVSIWEIGQGLNYFYDLL